MTTLETRTLYRIDKTRRGGITGVHSAQYAMLTVDQEAIPWCTTHDMSIYLIDGVCFAGWMLINRGEVAPCEISMGGPDHKWWKDEA